MFLKNVKHKRPLRVQQAKTHSPTCFHLDLLLRGLICRSRGRVERWGGLHPQRGVHARKLSRMVPPARARTASNRRGGTVSRLKVIVVVVVVVVAVVLVVVVVVVVAVVAVVVIVVAVVEVGVGPVLATH